MQIDRIQPTGQQKFISLKVEMPEIKGVISLTFVKGHISAPKMAFSVLQSHQGSNTAHRRSRGEEGDWIEAGRGARERRRREEKPLQILFIKALNPSMKVQASWPNHMLKAILPILITLVTGSCKLPCRFWDPNQVLCRSRKCSLLLRHLSSPQIKTYLLRQVLLQ